jgi:hypothetical protein
MEFILQTYFHDGNDNVADNLTLEITTNHNYTPLIYNITLDNTTPQIEIELSDNNGIGIPTLFHYNTTTGDLIISNTMFLPNTSILLDILIGSTSYAVTYKMNFNMYDVLASNTLYIITDPKYVRASTLFIQHPTTNKLYWYNLTNSDIDSCTIIDSKGNTLSHSPTGVATVLTSERYTTTNVYTYYDSVTQQFITVQHSSTIVFQYNTYIPSTDTSFTDNGFLFKGFPTVNTLFTAVLNSSFETINTYPQKHYITPVNVASYNIHDVTGNTIVSQYLGLITNNNTSINKFLFDDITGLVSKDYIVTFNNYIVNNIAETPINQDIFISGQTYFVAAANDCTSITDGTNVLPISSKGSFYIDPNIFGTIGTSIQFTGVNHMLSTNAIPLTDVIYNQPYYIATGNIEIDGIMYTIGDVVFLTDKLDINGIADLVLLTLESVYDDVYNVHTYKNIDIYHPTCDTYTIYNNSLETITVNIEKLVYTIDVQGEYQLITKAIISSGDNFAFTPMEDGVYKFTYIEGNEIKTLYIVSICNVEQCMINYINDLVCCSTDSNCECNLQGHDCKYIDRSNFIATSLLYDLLKNMIIDIIGINQVYTDTISDDALYLHDITDIISRINNFCNNCDE